MGLSLGCIIGAVTDPGSLVKDAINTVLPKNLAIVGDLAGAYVDFQTGNGLGAAQHALQGLKDLPQAMNALQSTTARCGSHAFEPTPPPVRPPLPQPANAHWQLGTAPGWRGTAITPSHTLQSWQQAAMNATHALAQTATTQTPGLSSLTQFAQTLEKALKLLQDALKQFAPGATLNPKPETTSTSTKPETTSTTTKPSSTDSADDDTKSTSSSSTSSSKKSTSTDSSSKPDSNTTAALKKLDKMSDADFMAAVREGKIPDDVIKDPKAMLAIQQRINHIGEMTKLMTSMMQALHDMQMSIIQNVRV